VRPGSSPPSSAATPCPSISAARTGSSAGTSASGCTCATGSAPRWAVTGRRACATPTTTNAGPTAAAPTSTTDASSAPDTTPASTTRLRDHPTPHRPGQLPPPDVSG
jgi:hypothetical protein